jgi:hypothetical protein
MSDETTTATTSGDTEDSWVERASQAISDDMFGAESHAPAEEATEATSTETDKPVGTVGAADAAGTPPVAESPTPAAPTPLGLRPAPKSWAAEQHPTWNALPPSAQDYIEKREKDFLNGLEQYKSAATFGKSLHEVVAPFQAILDQQGIDAPRAVATLLTAHQRLTQGDQTSRQAAYDELGRSLGLAQNHVTAASAPTVDPTVKALQDRLNTIESSWSAREQAALQEAKARTAKDVEVFASDPAHAYFDEVAPDIVTLIKTGLPLQEAYEKAIWANPVTRAKEIARVQTEHEATLRENARLEALPKRKATSVNVRSRETSRAPTEPLGSMDDTLKSTLAEMKARV